MSERPQADVRHLFREQGFVFPLAALVPAEVRRYRAAIDRTLAGMAAGGRDVMRHKGHVALPWLAELVRHPRVLAPVIEILGPDLLCWTTNFFIKRPRDPGFVSFHQDATYWGLSSDEVLTAWVALTDARRENGCMAYWPKSHLLSQLPHRDTFAPHNLLTRGQEIEVAVDPSETVDVELKAGEMAFHHVLTVHGSGPNASDDWRIGVAIRYMPTRIRQLSEHRDSATLVSGHDRFGHFDLERHPPDPPGDDFLTYYDGVVARHMAILLEGVATTGRAEA